MNIVQIGAKVGEGDGIGKGNAGDTAIGTAFNNLFKKEFPDTPLSCIGKIVARPGLKIRQKVGIMEIATRGYVHFQ